MDNLMERNIYDVKGNVLICGACLPRMEKKAFNELIKDFDTVMYLCLEKEHINMAITKICGMLSTGLITSLTFTSVNKSPHCTQMHFIKREIERIMDNSKLPRINNIVVEKGKIHEISDEAISLSKDLVALSERH